MKRNMKCLSYFLNKSHKKVKRNVQDNKNKEQQLNWTEMVEEWNTLFDQFDYVMGFFNIRHRCESHGNTIKHELFDEVVVGMYAIESIFFVTKKRIFLSVKK